MLLTLRQPTILLMPLWSKTLLTLTLSMITTMAKATGVKTLIIPMVAMVVAMVVTMVMTMPLIMTLTMSSIFLYSRRTVCVGLRICCPIALLWGLSALPKNPKRRNANRDKRALINELIFD